MTPHRAQRPPVDVDRRYLSEPGPNGLFTRLTRVGLLVEAFQHHCLDHFGLRFVDYSVLRLLQLAGAPYEMAPTELSDIVLRSSGGMTKILDRLELAKLIGRTADHRDRRRIVVRLTTTGLRTVKRANARYSEERGRMLESLSASEVGQLDRAVRRLLAVLDDDPRETASEAPGGAGASGVADAG